MKNYAIFIVLILFVALLPFQNCGKSSDEQKASSALQVPSPAPELHPPLTIAACSGRKISTSMIYDPAFLADNGAQSQAIIVAAVESVNVALSRDFGVCLSIYVIKAASQAELGGAYVASGATEIDPANTADRVASYRGASADPTVTDSDLTILFTGEDLAGFTISYAKTGTLCTGGDDKVGVMMVLPTNAPFNGAVLGHVIGRHIGLPLDSANGYIMSNALSAATPATAYSSTSRSLGQAIFASASSACME